jgi:GTP-binding protein LepA
VLEAIVEKIPPPDDNDDKPLRALIFDSYYDPYRGVVASVRIVDGCIRAGMKIKFMAGRKVFETEEVGIFTNTLTAVKELASGDVGYVTASIKDVSDTRVGDTITGAGQSRARTVAGYKTIRPMVFCGIYPADGSKYGDLKESLAKLKLNDASLLYEPETSAALGFGFRCGFLGLLHLEITQQRLDREYDLDLITTAPSVVYKVVKTDGGVMEVDNPSNLPPAAEIDYMEEPFVDANVMLPSEYVGPVMEICQRRRGIFKTMEYIEEKRVVLRYELPLNEIIYDFFDALKSKTKGYASLDYEIKEYRRADLVKLDIYLNGEIVDALSFIVHRDNAYARGRNIAEKLKKEIPKHMFEIPIQAAVGGKIIARETVGALRKDVLAKCYGGDITRKKKLLEKQKEGKKRMRQFGTVEVPQEAFMAVLKLDE